MDIIKISGHRGYKAKEIENSKAAILRAIQENLDYVEIDIRATSDNIPVLFHYRKINKFLNAKGKLTNFSLEELKSLEYRNGQTILTLDECLSLIKGKIKAILDIKAKGIEQKIINLIKKNKLEQDVIVQSLSKRIIQKFQALEPNLQYSIYRHYLGKEFIPHRLFTPLFYKLLIDDLTVKYVSLDGPFMYDAFIKHLTQEGYKIILGAMKLEKYLKKVKKWNISIINANNPARIKKILKDSR